MTEGEDDHQLAFVPSFCLTDVKRLPGRSSPDSIPCVSCADEGEAIEAWIPDEKCRE